MRKHLLVLLLPALAACDFDLADLADCRYEDDWVETIPVGSTDLVRVIAERGDLEVRGRSGLHEVVVHAAACSEHPADLDDIEVVLQRSGSSIRMLGLVPHGAGINARLDLVLEVPDYMLAEIDHESGDLEVSRLSGVYIFDDSGDIDVFDIDGDVEIEDGSGDIRVEDVFGDLFVYRDTSGRLTYHNVRGRVTVPR